MREDLGIKLGKSKVNKKGQYSLSITIPKNVLDNFNIQLGDTVEFYRILPEALEKDSKELYKLLKDCIVIKIVKGVEHGSE